MSSQELLNNAVAPQKFENISGVEMFGIINKQGRMGDFWGKKALELTKERRDIFLMQIVLQKSMQQDFDGEFGSMSHCTTHHGRMKFIHFPLEKDKTVLIVADPKTKDRVVIDRVRRFLVPSKITMVKNRGIGN